MNNKTKIASLLVVLGVVFYIFNFIVYVPRYSAYWAALRDWELAKGAPPDPAAFGWDFTAQVVSQVLVFAAYILMIVGGAYLVWLLVLRVGRQLGYVKNGAESAK